MIKSSSEAFNELTNSEIFNVFDCGESNEYKFPYLSFVKIEPEKVKGQPTVSQIGLEVKQANGYLDCVNINPDDTNSLDAHDTIVNHAVDIIIERARNNSKKDTSNYFTVDLLKPTFYSRDEKKRDEIQGPNHGRKLISKILGISNIIAMESRMGAGNYVILPEMLYKIIEDSLSKKFKGLYKPSKVQDSLAGLNLLCSDKLQSDEFIVGRKPKPDQVGLHLITSDIHLSNYISNTPDDITQKVSFKLLFPIDEDNTVYSCKVNWTDETI